MGASSLALISISGLWACKMAERHAMAELLKTIFADIADFCTPSHCMVCHSMITIRVPTAFAPRRQTIPVVPWTRHLGERKVSRVKLGNNDGHARKAPTERSNRNFTSLNCERSVLFKGA
jgi:hypothetical protein